MSTTTSVTVDELIERTDALLRGIAERALQTERDRPGPQETLDEIQAAGLSPVGGQEDWDEQAETYGRVRMGTEPISQMW